MRRFYDSTDAAKVPAGADGYLGYIDGSYQSYKPLLARFPGTLVVPISVDPSSDHGLVFDGPPDNATWPQVVQWVARRRSSGADPTVYTDQSSWTTAQAAFRAANVAYPHWWIANYNGVPTIPDGAIGHQYATVVGRYDTSVVADYWPGVDPAPTTIAPAPPAPVTATMEDDEMALLISVTPDPTVPGATTGAGIFLVSGAMVAHVTDGTSYNNLINAGLKTAAVSPQTYQAMVSASSALQGQLGGSLAVSGNLTVGGTGA